MKRIFTLLFIIFIYSLSYAQTVVDVTSPTPDGTFKIGGAIVIRVNFSANVTVTGIPQILLETGAVDRNVNYVSGSGTATLVFNYVVQPGDISGDLNYQSTSALTLNGGTISTGSLGLPILGNGALTDLAGTNAFVIDGIVPSFSSVIATPNTGTLRIGQSV